MKFTSLEALFLVSTLIGAAQAGKAIACNAQCTLMPCFPTWCKQKGYVSWKWTTKVEKQYFTITAGKTVTVTAPGEGKTITVTKDGGDEEPVTKTVTITSPAPGGAVKTTTVTAEGENETKTVTVTSPAPGGTGKTVTVTTTCTRTKTVTQPGSNGGPDKTVTVTEPGENTTITKSVTITSPPKTETTTVVKTVTVENPGPGGKPTTPDEYDEEDGGY